jgi:DNA-binding transcriptional MerR regulator
MLKIGDFSRISQVSVEALRHYDTMGLLKPAVVDQMTGYRYYKFQQIGRIKRILALKDLGLSLEQIAPMLEGEVTTEQLKGMLKLKQAEIARNIEAEQERLVRVQARLRQIEMEINMPDYEVIIKQVQPQLAATMRRVLPSHPDVVGLFEELIGYIAQHNVTPALGITIWHDESYLESGVDAEAAATLKEPVPESDLVKVYELPIANMASTVHNGSYNRLNLAYDALNEWIDSNCYRVVGPGRELYHFLQEPVRRDDESYVTEIQLPVEKA